MYNRAARTTLQGLGRLSRSTPTSSVWTGRQFSTTPQYGVRVLFQETENQDLNKVLQEIQDKVILPARLPPKKQAVVFNPSKRSYLEQNPIVIEVEGLEHNFTTIDKHHDIPRTTEMFFAAMDKMETNTDWQNLATMLAGYQSANIKTSVEFHGKIARIASNKGFGTVLIECAKQADKTGFYIRNKELLNHILTDITTKVAAAEGDWERIQQLVKKIDSLLDVIQRPAHLEKANIGTTRQRLHFSLTARGQILLARSALAKAKHEAGEPTEKELELLQEEIELFSSLWAHDLETKVAEIPEFAELLPGASNKAGKSTPPSLSSVAYVKSLARNVKGIRAAHHTAKQHPEAFKSVEDKLDSILLPVAKSLDLHVNELISTSPNGSALAEEYKGVVGN